MLPLCLAVVLLQVPQDKVDAAVEAGMKALRESQREDGSWKLQIPGETRELPVQDPRLGATSAAVWALAWGGAPADDPALRKGVAWIVANAPLGSGDHAVDANTYETSLMACALSEVLQRHGEKAWPPRTRGRLQEAAAWLVAAQQVTGGWSYAKTAVKESHDHSNSQFAMMGLRAAHNAKARVPALVWERELTHWKTAQLQDGGWAYGTCYGQRGAGVSTPSMTGAGVYALAAGLAGVTGKGDAESLAKDPSLRKALEALARHHKEAAGTGDHYWLMSVERACLATGTEKLGGRDWWNEGAERLLQEQAKDGFWRGTVYGLADHCFAILFLKRATVPLADGTGARKPKEQE